MKIMFSKHTPYSSQTNMIGFILIISGIMIMRRRLNNNLIDKATKANKTSKKKHFKFKQQKSF